MPSGTTCDTRPSARLLRADLAAGEQEIVRARRADQPRRSQLAPSSVLVSPFTMPVALNRPTPRSGRRRRARGTYRPVGRAVDGRDHGLRQTRAARNDAREVPHGEHADARERHVIDPGTAGSAEVDRAEPAPFPVSTTPTRCCPRHLAECVRAPSSARTTSRSSDAGGSTTPRSRGRAFDHYQAHGGLESGYLVGKLRRAAPLHDAAIS